MSWDALIADPRAQRHYLIVARPYDPDAAGQTARYWSTHRFLTTPDDTPALVRFEPRVSTALSIDETVISGGRLRGLATADAGYVGLRPDAALRRDLRRLVWQGRPIEVYLGFPGARFADHRPIFTGLMEGVEANDDEVRILVRDKRRLLERELQTATFDGTGDLGGPVELSGRLKPLSLGYNRDVEPVWIGNSGTVSRWMVSSRPIWDVPAVRSGGALLTKVSGVPAPGQYRVVPADGIFELGGTTLDLRLTCDVQGVVDAQGAWQSSAAQLCRWVATTMALPATEIDADAFDAAHAVQPAAVDLWLPEGGDALDVVSQIADAAGMWVGFGRDGRLTIDRFDGPAAVADASFGPREIMALRRVDAAAPVAGVRLGVARTWSVFDAKDVVGSVGDAERARLTSAWRYGVGTAPATTLAAWPLAEVETLEAEASLADLGAGRIEAQRLADVYGRAAEVWEAEVITPMPMTLRRGATVALTDAAMGLETWRAVVIGCRGVAGRGRLTLTVWGWTS